MSVILETTCFTTHSRRGLERGVSLREGAASSPHLALLNRGGVLVAHGADLHAALPLPVPLVEELLHNAVRPLAVQLQGLGGVAQVRAVHHVTKHLRNTNRAHICYPLNG